MSIVKINAITIPEGRGEELEKRFAQRKHAVDSAPGFEGFQLLRPTAGESRYFVVTQWTDQASYEAWRDGDSRSAHQAPAGEAPRKPVASGAELLEFEVVLGSSPEAS
ncbi:antibiotic biosynthesis monooxygenase family protein [Corynebacterium sp. A21]|uniref:antibiotic biosynthesis monooxygenase family protein n=1 Tax=Corynebacterium sp. A21 TaxID=3457318 RepID=UPI003FD1BEBF